jgi:hypothetical protein
VTFGSHVTTTKKKARGKSRHARNLLPVRDTSGQDLFRSCDFVTSGQKARKRRRRSIIIAYFLRQNDQLNVTVVFMNI